MSQPSQEGEAPGVVRRARRYGAVIFDMDGVLVESEHLWERMWRRFAAARGQYWTSVETRRVQGMSAPEWSDFLARFGAAGDTAVDAERAVVGDMIRALDAGEIALLPGAARMVEGVASRAPIALASSAPRQLIDAVLARHELRSYFTATVSSAEVVHGKPCPDVYLATAERLEVLPRTCLAVEDSSNGLRAAAAAGMAVVAYPNRGYPPAADALAGARFTAGSLDEVRRHLVESLAQPMRG